MDKHDFDAHNAAGRLPSPQGVALRLLQLTRSENVSLGEIASVIKSDPALAGRVVAAANAAVQPGHRRIVSVAQALAVNGLASTCRLALGLSIVSRTRSGHCTGFDYGRFWQSSLLVALAMHALATRQRFAAAEDVFTVGLLARVGRLALATLHPNDYGAVLAAAADADRLPAAERERFATDSIELSRYLLADWGIPEVFVDAVALATTPIEEQDALSNATRAERIAHALRVADHLAAFALSGDPARVAGARMERSLTALEMERDALVDLWTGIGNAWPAWQAILGLGKAPLPQLPADATIDDQSAAVAAVPQEPSPPHPAQAVAAIESAAAAGDQTRLRVLANTRDPVLRAHLSALLEPVGATTKFADNDDAALAYAIDTSPQIIVHDWCQPGAEGLGVCRTLRDSAFGRAAYVLVFGDDATERALLEALGAGADDYLAREASRAVLAAHLRVARRVAALQEELSTDRDRIHRFAADLSAANRRLQGLAQSDPLTGLPNRRYALDRLDQEWRQARASGTPLSCLMIDIDHFKRINDEFGHGTGDLVLSGVARLLRMNARTLDTVCRVGGEEFLIVCSNTDRAAALRFGERLRLAVEEANHDVDGVSHHVTISVGVASAGGFVDDPAHLVKSADEALYRAKRQGRNRLTAV